MGYEHPIKQFHPESLRYTDEVSKIPFDKLPLYINHPDSYVRYAATRRLSRKTVKSYNNFIRDRIKEEHGIQELLGFRGI